MLTFIWALIVALICAAPIIVTMYRHAWQKDFKNNPKNFPFRHRGMTFWYSRACAISGFIFAKNEEGEWCVLANKRGKGAPDYQHHWNGIAGYVDFNATTEETVVRECYEEMNVKFPIERLQFYKLISNPSENHQNITARYFAKVEDMVTTDPYLTPSIPTTENGGEKDEVEAVAWIPISQIDEYQWAFNHNAVIKEIFENKIQ